MGNLPWRKAITSFNERKDLHGKEKPLWLIWEKGGKKKKKKKRGA